MKLRSLTYSVYLPSFLFAVGQGAVVPVIALEARHVGASAALAGLVVALSGVGILLFDIPSGWLIARMGEEASLAAGSVVLLLGLLGSIIAQTPGQLGAATLATGCGWSVWTLARLSYVGDIVPLPIRGRALSTLGGVARIGTFVGPFLGAGAISVGGLRSAYVIHAVFAIAACAVVLRALGTLEIADRTDGVTTPTRFRDALAGRGRVFLTAGFTAATILAIRAIRQAVVPLWAVHIGLGPETASIVYGISVGAEVLLFYPAGLALDRFGRKPVATASLACMSVGLFLLPLTHGMLPFLVVAAVVGAGNGLGSGIVMTLGVDFSPAAGRAQFLSAWRVCGDVGTAGGPLALSAVIGATTIGLAAFATGFIGVIGAAVLLLFVPETLERQAPDRPEFELLAAESS